MGAAGATRTIVDAARELRSGAVTCRQLVDECLARIDEVEEGLHAWVFVDAEGARETAERLDAELRDGRDRGPLHGVPIGVKDIFDVEGWPTEAGLPEWAALQQQPASEDATSVACLRLAGAVLLGKTVTTPLASFDPAVTLNPWNAERSPGGSSSGSAAAVAAGMCLAALGSQTGGSVTRPASYCGVCGLKPTFGRVSRFGVVPLAPSLDHVGAFAATPADLALLHDVLAGPDPRDPYCAAAPAEPIGDAVVRAADEAAPRLGVLRGLFESDAQPAVRERFTQTVASLQEAGAEVVEVTLPSSFDDVLLHHRILMATEAAAEHQLAYAQRRDHFPRHIRELVEEGLSMPATAYARARDLQVRLRRDLLRAFGEVDAWVCPATTGPAPTPETTGDPRFNSPWSFVGLPAANVPMGRDADGLPLGFQLVGPPFAEGELLVAAAWCHRQLGPA